MIHVKEKKTNDRNPDTRLTRRLKSTVINMLKDVKEIMDKELNKTRKVMSEQNEIDQ